MNETVGLSPTAVTAEPAATTLVSQSTGSDWLARYASSLMGVFGTPQRVLVRGAGALVWDADGKDTWTSSAGLR